ncbi:MAG: hypothetical protein ACLPKE_00150 [Streptosporangiaceae bacterium]
MATKVWLTSHRGAMIVMGGFCAAAAFVTALFVSDKRTSGHRIVPRAPDAGCAKPIRTLEVTS